jgi:hypothetical protein
MTKTFAPTQTGRIEIYTLPRLPDNGRTNCVGFGSSTNVVKSLNAKNNWHALPTTAIQHYGELERHLLAGLDDVEGCIRTSACVKLSENLRVLACPQTELSACPP